MNPRQFCRERGYTSVIALTYSFDPLFFERVVLSDLWYGGTGDIVVVGDQHQISEATARCIGQIRHLGKRYHLTATNCPTFHPKVIVRLGQQGAAVWLGSGNLTHGGWGGNQELAIAWKIDAKDPAAAPTIQGLISQVMEYCVGAIAKETIRRLVGHEWLTSGGNRETRQSSLIMTSPSRPLANDLLDRWSGRRFTHMRVFTGSTDEGGRFIEWCHNQFGIEHCAVAVNPNTSAFKPELLDKLPLSVTIAPKPAAPYLHAKFYWFDGPDGCAAIVGSANCSAAAWLIAPMNGGNVETIFVYDRPTPELFAKVLERFPSEQLPPAQVPGLGQFKGTKKATASECPYTMTDLTLYGGLGELRARVTPPVPTNGGVSLRFGSDEIPTRPSGEDRSLWIGTSPDSSERYATQFGQLVVRLDGLTYTTPPRWLDHADELRHAGRERHIGEALQRLSGGGSASERNQLLEDIELITKSLFGEPNAFPDPPRTARKKELTPVAPAVKPGDLIRSLADIEQNGRSLGPLPDSQTQLTLHGVMRVLFNVDDEVDEAATATEPDDSSEDSDTDDQSEHESPRKRTKDPVVVQTNIPSENQRRRLKKQIVTLQDNLGTDNFVKRCTATQMVQAVAFPLACAALGHSSHWLTAEEARQWVLRTTDLLFRVELENGQRHGLLESVRLRYESEGRNETFMQAVGDGTLWLAIIGAMGRIDWASEGGPMQRALALREVVHAHELICSADTGRLSALVPRLQLMGEGKKVLTEAARVTGILADVETILETRREQFINAQERGKHLAGDLVWRKSGWGIARTEASITKGEKMQVYWRSSGREVSVMASGFIVNVRLASQGCDDLTALMAMLHKATWISPSRSTIG